MKKLLIGLGIIIAILGITNPSAEDHKQAVTKVIVSDMKIELQGNPFAAFGVLLATKMIDGMVNRDNYIIFSLTKVSAFGESKIVGYGVLGNVYISDDLKEKMKK